MAGFLSGMWQELWKNAGGSSMAHALANQPSPRNCKIQDVELGFVHCCSFSASRRKECSVLLVTGCVQLGRALAGCRQGGGAQRVGRGLHARHAHLNTCTLAHRFRFRRRVLESVCWNPFAGIRWNFHHRTCLYDHRGCISVIFKFID